jgi:hypothetical protein
MCCFPSIRVYTKYLSLIIDFASLFIIIIIIIISNMSGKYELCSFPKFLLFAMRACFFENNTYISICKYLFQDSHE